MSNARTAPAHPARRAVAPCLEEPADAEAAVRAWSKGGEPIPSGEVERRHGLGG